MTESNICICAGVSVVAPKNIRHSRHSRAKATVRRVSIAGYNVDSASESRRTKRPRRRAFKDFHALDVVRKNREISRQMSRMRRSDVDAVEADCHLVKRAAAHTNIGLHAVAALPNVHAHSIFQEVVDGVDGKFLDFFSANNCNLLRSLRRRVLRA